MQKIVGFYVGIKIIEDYVHFGFDCTLMDTDFHYVVDLNKNIAARDSMPILIKRGTWVSSNCKFMKGSSISENSIIVGGTLINKDYSREPVSQIYAGTPAKPIKSGYRRLYNAVEELYW